MNPLTLPEALAKLAAQGGPDDIALYLRTQGDVGARRDGALCPVAQYVGTVTGQKWYVGKAFVTDRMGAGRFDLPPDVATFVGLFDRGHYSDLERDDA